MCIFNLTKTQAAADVKKHNTNYGILVVRNNVPQLFLPISKEYTNDWSSYIRIDPDNIEEITKTTRVFSGSVYNMTFTVDRKLF